MFRLRQFRSLQLLVTMFVMLQLVVVQAMVASGELHKHLHDHADESNHECAVTLILGGGYDTVAPDIVPVEYVPEQPPVAVNVPHAVDAVPSHLVGGVLAHAPPRGP